MTSVSTTTESDHKPVMAKIMVKRNFQPKPKNIKKCFKIPNLKHHNTRNQYRNEVVSLIAEQQ